MVIIQVNKATTLIWISSLTLSNAPDLISGVWARVPGFQPAFGRLRAASWVIGGGIEPSAFPFSGSDDQTTLPMAQTSLADMLSRSWTGMRTTP